MHRMGFAWIVVLCTLTVAPLVASAAWVGPTASPPNNNVPAPINVGTVAQVKSSGLGVDSLAVFGNAILNGVGRYFNFGSTAGSSGYGIRDNAGLLEFKNSGGSWASLQSTIFGLVGGAGSWTASGNNIYNSNTGNVGIGTAAPSYKLDVNGSGRFAVGPYTNDWFRVTGGGGIYWEAFGGGWYMQDSTWIRSYNSKPVYMSAGFDTGSPSGVGCSGGLGGGYTFRVCGTSNVTSNLVVGSATLATNGDLYMPWKGEWLSTNINRIPNQNVNVNAQVQFGRMYDDDGNYFIDANVQSRMNSVNINDIYDNGNVNANAYYDRSVGLWMSQLRLSQQLGPVYLSDSSLICNGFNGVVVGMSTPNWPAGVIYMYWSQYILLIMKLFNPTSIISPSSVLSIVSLLVAGAALFYALSSHGSGGTVAIPPQRPLTPENPASALPHAEGLYPVSGVVESVTADAIVIHEGTNTSSIKVGKTTQIYTQGKQKDPAVLQKDVAQFNDTLRAAMGSTAVFIAPSSYELNPMRISEIQPGVQVMVMVGGDGTAVQVTVLNSSGPQR